MRVLIVEDEVALAKNMRQLLQESCSYTVDVSHDGIEGLYLAQNFDYDLILLDLMLPGLPGFQLLEKLRAGGDSTPVLILTARGETEDLVQGLNTGADDYLRKPFHIQELVARCNALIRRNHHQTTPVLGIGDLCVNTHLRSVQVATRDIVLTTSEYKILCFLLLNQGRVISKTELTEHLYDAEWERDSNVIESHISSLRRKLCADDKTKFIQTVRGHGYLIAS